MISKTKRKAENERLATRFNSVFLFKIKIQPQYVDAVADAIKRNYWHEENNYFPITTERDGEGERKES